MTSGQIFVAHYIRGLLTNIRAVGGGGGGHGGEDGWQAVPTRVARFEEYSYDQQLVMCTFIAGPSTRRLTQTS